LFSKKDDEFSFLWTIKQSSKNTLRISLHYQEEDSKTGLLRIDYNGGHTNPQSINEYVPEKFYPYAGVKLTKSHIHYHVQGYPVLAWAIPLEEDDFLVKEISENDFNITLAEIIKLFAKTINVETVININILLI
jgi:hypothetical protein